MKQKPPRKPWRRYRSAITGRYVSRAFAEGHPDTTISETVQPKEEQETAADE